MEKTYQRVALIGLDGSGKSANISRMKDDPDYLGYKFLWVRWKPTLLKPAYWLLEKKVSQKSSSKKMEGGSIDGKKGEEQAKLNADYNSKSGLKERIFKNSIIRGLWMFLALLDYFVQFQIKTLPYVVKKENIIFDRFYLDLFVDQGINFGYSPEQIDREVKKNQKLFAHINEIVYIRVSPEVCYKRKNDIPNMDYLNRRYAIYEYLARVNGWKSINGELPFDEVYKNIKAELLAS